MSKRQLGKNGPLVSAIGLGCMGMSVAYGRTNDDESTETIKKALDLGVTLFDTADMYGWGHNEELLGKAIKGKRDNICIATKMGFIKNGDGFAIDTSPQYIKTACDASLKRLGIDTIDLYYLHRVDTKTPIEESMLALMDLVKAGKIRHIGLSDVKSETIERAHQIYPIAAIQSEYSIWERAPENKVLPTCEKLDIGFVSYSPLGRGFLTGTITETEQFAQDDFRRVLPRFQGNNFEKNKQLLAKLNNIAKQKKCSVAQLSLAWLLAQRKDIVAIPGTKRINYLSENIQAIHVELTAEDLQILNLIFPIGITAGEKYPEYLNFEN